MRLIRRVLLAGAAIVPVVLGAGTPASASCEELAIVPVGGFYLDVRSTEPLDVWVYEESNGIAGLQRGGTGDLSDDTHCTTFDAAGNPIPADTLIF